MSTIIVLSFALGIPLVVVSLMGYIMFRSGGSWFEFPGKRFLVLPPIRTRTYIQNRRVWVDRRICVVGVYWGGGSWTMCHGGRQPHAGEIKAVWSRIEKRVYRRFRRAGYSLEPPTENA